MQGSSSKAMVRREDLPKVKQRVMARGKIKSRWRAKLDFNEQLPGRLHRGSGETPHPSGPYSSNYPSSPLYLQDWLLSFSLQNMLWSA